MHWQIRCKTCFICYQNFNKVKNEMKLILVNDELPKFIQTPVENFNFIFTKISLTLCKKKENSKSWTFDKKKTIETFLNEIYTTDSDKNEGRLAIFAKESTVWKVSKYGVFSGLHFPAFGLNTERYFVFIQTECGKIWTRKNSVFGHFSRSVDDSDFSFLLVDDNDQFQDVHFKSVLD